jgi:hypothetical protein
VGPHAIAPWGAVLVRALGRGDRSPAWLATDWALALAAQALLAALVYRLARRPGWLAVVALVLAVPALAVGANVLALAVVPAHFLIERDPTPAHGEWPVACALTDVGLVPGPLAGETALAAAGEAWVLRSSDLRLALLAMPDCRITPLGLTWSNVGTRVVAVAPGGQALLETAEAGSGRAAYAYVAGPERAGVAVPAVADRSPLDGVPILSRDGAWVAWITREPDPSRQASVRLAPTGGGAARAVPLDALGTAGLVLVEADVAGGELALARNERELVVVGLDGAVRRAPLQPAGLEPLAMTWRRAGPGWVAWDGYRERDAYRIAWETAGGRGQHRIPLGRSPVAVAVAPDGRHVALSTTGAYSIGDVADAVAVLRAADGTEAFRRYLVRYARSGVAFLDSAFFAYTEVEAGKSRLVVLRVPG